MRKKIITYAVFILLILLLQITVLDYVKIYHVKPNILVVFIIIASFFRGSYEGAFIGFFTGLAQDMASGKVLGFYAIIGLYLGLSVGAINKRLYRENLIINVFFTFIFSFIYESMLFIILKWGPWLIGGGNGMGINTLDAFRGKILPESIYNSIISIVVFFIFIKTNRRFEKESKIARKY